MEDQETFNLSEYFEVLHRRRATVIFFFLMTILTVGLFTYLSAPVYRATAVLLIDIESPNVMTATGRVELSSQGHASFQAYKEYFRTQMSIITSYSIVKKVFDEFNLGDLDAYADSEEPVKKLLSNITAEPIRDTRLLSLNVDNPDPVLAAKIANRVAQIYIRHNLTYISNSESLNLLKNEYLRLRTKLSEQSKIYKKGHPEMVRLHEEMAEVVENISRGKDRGFAVDDDGGSAHSQYRRALEGLKANNVSLVEPALVPVTPAKPNKMLNLFLAVIVGFFGGIGLAFLFEYQDDTVKDAEDMEELNDWPLLGKIPEIFGHKKESYVLQKPNHLVSEAYRFVRTQLSFLSEKDKSLTSMVISSLGPQEGKTTTACNLAITLAQGRKKILLVDADMRRPRLHNIFKRNKDKSLSDFLAGEASYNDVIQKTDIENLSIVSNRQVPHNPSELLTGGKMKEFIRESTKDFDFVLFDSPPISVITDAVILSALTDGVILVLESGKTPKKAVLRADKLLKNSEVSVIGAIINGVSTSGKEGYYYSYYNRDSK